MFKNNKNTNKKIKNNANPIAVSTNTFILKKETEQKKRQNKI